MYLTARQREFLSELIDIYREKSRSVHYVDLASALGVSKWTAYDMMTLLERKGMVTREYAIRERASAGGRSRVLFRPTDSGTAMLTDLTGGGLDEQEWEETKQRILSALEQAPAGEYQAVAEELLDALDSRGSPRSYWAAAMTALLLTAEDLRQRVEETPLLQDVAARVASPHARLMALAEVGASLPRRALKRVDLRGRLSDFRERHHTMVELMDRANQESLLRFLDRVVKRISGRA